MLYQRTGDKKWRHVAWDLLCRTTFSWRHIIGMREKTHISM